MGSLSLLAWRNVWSHRRRSLITIGAVAFSLAVATFSISFADGSYHQLVESAVRIQAGHVTLEHRAYRDAPAVDLAVEGAQALRERIARLPGVAAVKPLVRGQGVLQAARDAEGVEVIGIDPAVEGHSSILARRIVQGAYLQPGDGKQVVIGKALAERLHVTVGKKLVLSANDAAGVLVQELVRVRGIFFTGADELDGYLVQLPLQVTQRFYGLRDDQVTQLGVLLDRSADREALLPRLAQAAGPGTVALPWEKVMPDIAAFIRLDGGSNYVFTSVLVLLSLFTVLNTVIMSVLERTREFAVMLALGTPVRRIRVQLLLEGALVAGVGTLLGLAVGGIAAGWLEVHGFDLSSVYPDGLTISGIALDSRIYGRVTTATLARLGALTFGAAMAVSLLGLRRVSSIPVTQVLR